MKTISEGVHLTSTFQRDFETLISQFMVHLTQVIEYSVRESLDSLENKQAINPTKTSDLGADFITKDQALTILKISKPTLARYQKEELLPYYKVGRKVYFRMSEIVSATKITLNKAKKRKEATND